MRVPVSVIGGLITRFGLIVAQKRTVPSEKSRALDRTRTDLTLVLVNWWKINVLS